MGRAKQRRRLTQKELVPMAAAGTRECEAPSSSPVMVKPVATGWASSRNTLSASALVARGATSRLEGRYRLPLPAALADLAARVNDYLELLVRDELTRGLGVGHAAEHAGAQYPPAGHGHAQRDGDGARRFNGERRSAHHGGVELHGDDDHAALRNGEIGVGGTGLQSMRQTV